jgi:N4-gp56 family major capsid protein
VGNTESYDLNDPETVQKWERELHVQVALRTPLMSKKYGFVGDSDTALCQKKTKLWEPEGTRATVTLMRKLRGKPTYGNQELRGREEGINTSTFRWEINQIRHATRVMGRITKRRVTFDIWKNSLNALGTWFAELSEGSAMLHLAGVPYDVSTEAEWYLDGSDLGNTFSNTPRVPDTKHIMRVGHAADTDDSGVAADPAAIIDLDVISELKARAKNLPVPIRPCMVHGQELYVFFIHSYAARHMKDNSKWMSIMKAAMNERTVEDHPFWSGALGVWDGVLIVENNYIPPGLSSTNTRVADARRNVFCGAQALLFGLAKEYDKANMYINDEESWDYANNKGVAATTLAGMASPYYAITEQATTDDFAKIVCTSYAQELVTSL